MGADLTGLLGAVLAICLVLALAYGFTRYVVGRSAVGHRLSRHMRVLEQLSVGRDQKLLLVQVGEEIHLLGAAQGGITHLRTISPEEAERWRQEASQKAETMSFQKALGEVLRQRKK